MKLPRTLRVITTTVGDRKLHSSLTFSAQCRVSCPSEWDVLDFYINAVPWFLLYFLTFWPMFTSFVPIGKRKREASVLIERVNTLYWVLLGKGIGNILPSESLLRYSWQILWIHKSRHLLLSPCSAWVAEIGWSPLGFTRREKWSTDVFVAKAPVTNSWLNV